MDERSVEYSLVIRSRSRRIGTIAMLLLARTASDCERTMVTKRKTRSGTRSCNSSRGTSSTAKGDKLESQILEVFEAWVAAGELGDPQRCKIIPKGRYYSEQRKGYIERGFRARWHKGCPVPGCYC